MEKMLTVKEISEILRMKEIPTRRLLLRENLGVKIGKRLLVPEKDLIDWINARNRYLKGQRK